MLYHHRKAVRDMWKILIVEDEKPISELIRMNLAQVGYDCLCIYDGKIATDLLARCAL